MQTIEYHTVDKSTWGEGPWQSEPDKIQFTDPETGLPCLIVRNFAGALCGYVGVPSTHPWFAKGYDYIDASVHGGLTFSDFCMNERELTQEQRERIMKSWLEERGIMPTLRAVLGGVVSDIPLEEATYEQIVEACGICHAVETGEDDRVWWVGFDCSHAGDYGPGMEARMREIPGMPLRSRTHDVTDLSLGWEFDTYKPISYVKEQIANLARQAATDPKVYATKYGWDDPEEAETADA